MPRVDFLPAYDNSGCYTRHYQGTLLFIKYTWHELFLMLVSVLSIIAQIGLGIQLLIYSVPAALPWMALNNNTDVPQELILERPFEPFAFDVIVLFTVLFGAWYSVSGVLLEHEYEIVCHLSCMALASAYGTMEYFVCGSSSHKSLVLYRAMLGIGLTSLSIILAAKTILHPAWTEFVLVGVSERMIIMYKRFCKFLMLLKLEFVATAIFGILVLNAGVQSTSWQFMTMGIIIFYGLLLWAVGSLAVRKEKEWLVFCYVALSMIAPVFLPLEISARFPSKKVHIGYAPVVHIVAGAFCVLMRVYLHIELLKVFKNFDRGLINQAFLSLLTPEATGLLTGRRH